MGYHRSVISADSNAGTEKLREAIYHMETTVLKAFYDIAESSDKRLSNLECTTIGLSEWIEILDRRLTDLEKRVNFPNAP